MRTPARRPGGATPRAAGPRWQHEHRPVRALLGGDLSSPRVDRLARLVDRSSVAAVSAVHSRYRLLETRRAYGRNRIEAEGADRALAHWHATYYVELAERAAHGLQGPDERAWVDDALADYDNMHADEAAELDHWDRVGDATQQRLNLRYIARLLTRLDAASDAAVLHDFLVAAGKPSPFDRPASRPGSPSAGRVEAPVAYARACLERLA